MIPTINFRLIYVFLIINLRTRKIEDYGITQHPTAKWTAAIFKESFSVNDYPKYLIRDRDCIYGKVFREEIKKLNIETIDRGSAEEFYEIFNSRNIRITNSSKREKRN